MNTGARPQTNTERQDTNCSDDVPHGPVETHFQHLQPSGRRHSTRQMGSTLRQRVNQVQDTYRKYAGPERDTLFELLELSGDEDGLSGVLLHCEPRISLSEWRKLLRIVGATGTSHFWSTLRRSTGVTQLPTLNAE